MSKEKFCAETGCQKRFDTTQEGTVTVAVRNKTHDKKLWFCKPECFLNWMKKQVKA